MARGQPAGADAVRRGRAATRLLVPAKRLDEVNAIAKATIEQAVKVGDPKDKSVNIGPMVSRKQWETIQGYIHSGIEQGATLLTGGLGKPEGLETGNFVKPTIFTNVNNSIVDPKNFDPKCFVEHVGDTCIIPPNSFVLARTVEYFRIPRSVLTVCLGKSTYARCGIIVNVTPFEPEWEGYVTLEFSNTTPLPAKIYAWEGCAQVLFFESDEICEVSYKDRNGKYQGQQGVTLPKA